MSFPYESQEIKETSYETEVQLNSGNTCHIASYFNGYQRVDGSVGEYWWSMTKFVGNPSSVINIQNYVVATSGQTIELNDFNYVVNNIFNNPQQEDYYSTPEYVELKEQVTPKIKFIWGNLDSGGFCCFRPNASQISFYMINGYYERKVYNEDDVYLYSEYGYSTTPVAVNLNINDYDFTMAYFIADAIRISEFGDNTEFYGSFNISDKQNIDSFSVASYVMGDPLGFEYRVGIPITNMSIVQELQNNWISGDPILDPTGSPSFIFASSSSGFAMYDLSHHYDDLYQLAGNPWGDAQVDTEDNPYSDGGFGGSGGGNGNLDNETDTSDPSDCDIDNNSVDVTTTNLVRLYNPSASEISSFNNFLYSGITDSIANTLKKLTSDPLQYIISLGLVHFNPPTTSAVEICFGGIGSGVSAYQINKQMKSLDFGYIDIREEFKSFVDYNSRASIYLPYIGYRELDINEIRGSRIRLKYNVDMLTGSCTAYLHISRSSRGNGDCLIYNNMYFYEGNCMLQIPMFATDNRGSIQALMSALGAGVSLATGNPVGVVTNSVEAVAQQKVTVGRAGSISSNYGYMAGQEAFIVIERPIMQVPYNFGAFEGWTSNINEKVANLSGYTEVDPNTLWSDNFGHATQEECQMIKDIFNEGVYI